jgi:hypothetical protein
MNGTIRPPSTPAQPAVDAAAEAVPSSSSVTPARWRTMLSKPLAHPSTLDRRIAVLRGGALEPGALMSAGKSQAKANAALDCAFSCRSTEEPFSLGRGLMVDQRLFKLGIFLSFDPGSSPDTKKATRWVALA